MFRQRIIIHLQPQTSPHRIHILELVPSSSSHWFLSSCTTKDHTDPPNYETHDDMSFFFLRKMQISDDLLASSLHDNFHRLHSDNNLHLTALPFGTLEHNRESYGWLLTPKWTSLTSKHPLIQPDHSKRIKQRYCWSCHFRSNNS